MRKSMWVALAVGLAVAVLIPALRGLKDTSREQVPGDAAEAAPAKAKATDFSLPNTEGITESLSEQKGKVVILSFWATWCPPCRMEMPHLEALHKKYSGKPVRVLGVNLDLKPAELKEWMKRNQLTFSSLVDLDGAVAKQYQVEGIPTLLVIDQEGNIRQRGEGFDPNMEKNLSKLIDSLLQKK